MIADHREHDGKYALAALLLREGLNVLGHYCCTSFLRVALKLDKADRRHQDEEQHGLGLADAAGVDVSAVEGIDDVQREHLGRLDDRQPSACMMKGRPPLLARGSGRRA